VWVTERLKGAGVEAELLTLKGAGHGFQGGRTPKPPKKAMIAFFEQNLKKK